MKVIIFGATGAVGHHIAIAAVRQKHEVTLFVRSPRKLASCIPSDILGHCSVVEGDALDGAAVRQSMQGHSIAINAAGHVDDGQGFHRLFKGIVEAAAESLEHPKRLWMLAGATALDTPGLQDKEKALNDLPILYRTKYRMHTENYKVLLSRLAAGLDWSLLCPGAMYSEGQRPASAPAGQLETFTEDAQLALPGWTLSNWCPRIILSLLAIRQIGSFTVGLADAANVIVENLDSGVFSRKRVGLKRN